jgi:hypothetical protein
VAGDYTGSVHNETAALSADFAIKVHDSGGNLSGLMSVKPPLYGSGPLEGSANGVDVSFIVTSPIGKIAFIGTRSGQRITGTYTVTQPNGALEKGTFTLDRIPPVSRADIAVAKEEPTAVAAWLPDARLPEPAPASVTARTGTPRVLEHSDPKNLWNVAESARKRNLSNCMYGMPNCDRRPLTETEQGAVAESARKRNSSNCLYGMPSCNRNLLTQEELIQVQAKDKQRQH